MGWSDVAHTALQQYDKNPKKLLFGTVFLLLCVVICMFGYSHWVRVSTAVSPTVPAPASNSVPPVSPTSTPPQATKPPTAVAPSPKKTQSGHNNQNVGTNNGQMNQVNR